MVKMAPSSYCSNYHSTKEKSVRGLLTPISLEGKRWLPENVYFYRQSRQELPTKAVSQPQHY